MWIRVDDQFEDAPGHEDATYADFGLWLCLKGYANRFDTGGFVPESHLRRRGRPRAMEIVKRLVALGMIEPATVADQAGWRIVGHTQTNPTRNAPDQIGAPTPNAKQLAGRAGGIASGASRRANSAKHHDTAKHVASVLPPKHEASSEAPGPTRPDPARPGLLRVEPSMLAGAFREGIVAGLRALGKPGTVAAPPMWAHKDVARGLAHADPGLGEQAALDWVRDTAAEWVTARAGDAAYTNGWDAAQWVKWLDGGKAVPGARGAPPQGKFEGRRGWRVGEEDDANGTDGAIGGDVGGRGRGVAGVRPDGGAAVPGVQGTDAGDALPGMHGARARA